VHLIKYYFNAWKTVTDNEQINSRRANVAGWILSERKREREREREREGGAGKVKKITKPEEKCERKDVFLCSVRKIGRLCSFAGNESLFSELIYQRSRENEEVGRESSVERMARCLSSSLLKSKRRRDSLAAIVQRRKGKKGMSPSGKICTGRFRRGIPPREYSGLRVVNRRV